MAKKSRKVTKSHFGKYDLPEVFAFSIIVLVILICFSAIAFIASTKSF